MKPRLRVTLAHTEYDPNYHRTVVYGYAKSDGLFRIFPLALSNGCDLKLLDAAK